jgi:hypothetical protein
MARLPDRTADFHSLVRSTAEISWGNPMRNKLVRAIAGTFVDLDPLPAEEPAAPATAGSTPSSPALTTPAPAPLLDTTQPASALSGEPLSFEQIYAQQNVPAMPYSVEKLMKVIEGLRAMPREMQLSAINAMDAADDTWTMQDVLLDTERKTAALRAHQTQLAAQVQAAEQQMQQQLSSIDAEHQQKSEGLRKQLEQLQALLERTTKETSERQTAAREEFARARAASEQHTAEINTMLTRFGDITKLLAVQTKA